jgi:hypothetical protein
MRKFVLLLLIVPVAIVAYLRREAPPEPPAVPDYESVENAPTEAEINQAFDALLACYRAQEKRCSVQSKDLRELIRFERRRFQNHGHKKGLIRYFYRLFDTIDSVDDARLRVDLVSLLRNEVGLVKPIVDSKKAGMRILKTLQKPQSPAVAEVLAWMLGAFMQHPDQELQAGIRSFLSTSRPDDPSYTRIRRSLFSRLEKDLAQMPDYVPLALEQMGAPKESLEVRRQIVAIMHQAGTTEHRDKVVNALVNLAQNSTPEESSLRAMAIRSLARMGSVDSLPELLRLLDQAPEDLELQRSMAVALPFFTQSSDATKHIDTICNTAIHALKTDGLGKTAYKHAVRAITQSGNPNAIELLRPFAMQQDRYIGPSARKAIRKLEKAKAQTE